MLVLTRKVEEKIHIGRDITVTILRIEGQRMKIGIQAPSGMKVLRGELLDKQPRQQEPSCEPPALGAGLPTSPDGRPKVSLVAGDLRSEPVRGQETRAQRETVAQRDRSPDLAEPATEGLPSASTPPARTRRAPRDHLPSSTPPASRVGPAILFPAGPVPVETRFGN